MLDDSGLAHLVGYATARAAIEMKKVFAQHMVPLELKITEFSILVLVAGNAEVNQKQLGRAYDISPPNMAVTLDRMAERGWIERVRSTRDRRAQQIHLTRAGRGQVERAKKIAATMEEPALAALSRAERALLIEKAGACRWRPRQRGVGATRLQACGLPQNQALLKEEIPMSPIVRPVSCLVVAALAATALLAACDKTTTVTQTPNGTVTTTTISPTLQASQAIREINASVARAASAIQSSEAASQALTKTGDVIEDGVVTTKVKAALLTDPDVKGLRIEVDTRDGVVTLTGTVDKAASRDLAARIASDTGGVKSVVNQLVVKTSA
ncbi:MAG: BON domain-containing protein [Pseudomonadota bacterium]|nr:BON domain-containing protein [Pseudomonadota bacterium]